MAAMIAAHDKPTCPACGTSIDMASLDSARQRIHQLEEQAERLKAQTAAAGTLFVLPLTRETILYSAHS